MLIAAPERLEQRGIRLRQDAVQESTAGRRSGAIEARQAGSGGGRPPRQRLHLVACELPNLRVLDRRRPRRQPDPRRGAGGRV